MTDPYAPLRAAITAVDDPAERARQAGAALNDASLFQADLRQIRQAAVLELRDAGLSHAQVAAELGVTKARAQQIAEGKTTTAAGTPSRDIS